MNTNKNKNISHLTHEMKKTMEIFKRQTTGLMSNPF